MNTLDRIFIGTVSALLIICLATLSALYSARAEKRGACNALGGTFLNHDEVCLDIKPLLMSRK